MPVPVVRLYRVLERVVLRPRTAARPARPRERVAAPRRSLTATPPGSSRRRSDRAGTPRAATARRSPRRSPRPCRPWARTRSAALEGRSIRSDVGVELKGVRSGVERRQKRR
eukprot:30938-Pelagococcus_subviridis.AAC.9